MTHLSDPAPGSASRLKPRARLTTDAPEQSLDGTWRFRLQPGDPADDDTGVPTFASDGTGAMGEWTGIAVPGHWVLQGHGTPTYTNIRYPFPIDPPHAPDDNPTGDHLLRFDTSAAVMASSRRLLRFDGVESLATVWLNGVEVGWTTGSRLTTEFDVTELLRPSGNLLAVRVHQFSAASYLEDQDQWWLPGIFRSVTLLGRPSRAIDDVFLIADYDHQDGSGRIRPEVSGSFPIELEIAELGAHVVWPDAAAVQPFAVGAVEPWSAARPRRYDAVVRSADERVTMAIGFRTIAVEGDRLLANGRPLVFHGVNRHEIHSAHGRVFDEAAARADFELMKRHNIDAVRFAHQPPHPRTLDLTDELGLWVILECDLETHGFSEVDWRGNPSDDPAWRSAYLDRMRRTVERDKNHPSIVLWSLGNESGEGRNLAAMAQWVRRRDPSRPVHYEGDRDGAYSDVHSRMYATLEEIASICGEQTMPVHEAGVAAGAAQRAKPFLLCEYAHAMGNGPGALADYEALVDRYPRHHGGFVWEWRDHGLDATTPTGAQFHAYGGDFGEPVHDGAFVMDGMLLSDGTPTPSLHEYAAAAAPVRIAIDARSVHVAGRRHLPPGSTIDYVLVVEDDGHEVTRTGLAIVGPEPGTTARIDLPTLTPSMPGVERAISVLARWSVPQPWAPEGHVVARAQRILTVDAPRIVRLPNIAESAVLDRHGVLERVGGQPVRGPWLELWRAPTENDRSSDFPSYDEVDPTLSCGRGASGPSAEDRWRAHGLHRLRHRLVEHTRSDHDVRSRWRVQSAGVDSGVELDIRWTSTIEGLLLEADAVPFGDTGTTWPRIGLRFELPSTTRELVEWFGTGPAESYSDSNGSVRLGRFSSTVDGLRVRYARPQETGHRPGMRELLVGGLRVRSLGGGTSERPGFQLLRHTPQELTAAEYEHELPPSDRLVLILDVAQHGLGSRSCGPDVLPRHALAPRAASWSLLFAEDLPRSTSRDSRASMQAASSRT